MSKKLKGQLELKFFRPLEKDRNYHLGGRSFYFFDFDDNVAFLTTPIVLFHKYSEQEVFLSSGEFAQESKNIGKSGPYKDYFMNFNDESGSFRHFRDANFNVLDRLAGKKQNFIEDIQEILNRPDSEWKAPSWSCFYHATYNKRPVSLITARGHQAQTIKEGIRLIVKKGHLPYSPNYLSIYPVSNPEVRKKLGDRELKSSVAELKRMAIRESVEEAIRVYGHSPFHRFGMSDDDPQNVELITEEMRYLKKRYPEMKFFVIQTFEDGFTKREVLLQRTRRASHQKEVAPQQLALF